MNNNRKSYTLSEAISKLEGYCAYQERCHKEVGDKLIEMRMIPEARDHIIAHLIKENYLNEERFARAFARGKHNIKKWGKKRIIAELKRRNISKYNIKHAISEIDDERYLEIFNELSDKRHSQIQEKNIHKKRKKLANYLLYRGWEAHLVYDKVKELIG
ncbi:regulatory protein RecX [Muriicola sp. Z0-33]|uniref:regulatory protein RecX n=1 Tax=Muriicola sp. Z0-33 TaxID=2816957 RepID=UPI0022379E64|nr:regulatory protein RecX [Muriicola sp. Z0-33]MCW5514963.1 RecX family transcriptional regulator [Muriicola sp. Z0-33]